MLTLNPIVIDSTQSITAAQAGETTITLKAADAEAVLKFRVVP